MRKTTGKPMAMAQCMIIVLKCDPDKDFDIIFSLVSLFKLMRYPFKKNEKTKHWYFQPRKLKEKAMRLSSKENERQNIETFI